MKNIKSTETFILNSLGDTAKLAESYAPFIESRHIIGLYGPMGVGKTHFIKALVKALGGQEEEATSPTFSIHQEYEGEDVVIHHLDLYRLESDEEIESSGFWDLFYEDHALIMIEWMERLDEKLLPSHFTFWRMNWSLLPDGRRCVEIIKFNK